MKQIVAAVPGSLLQHVSVHKDKVTEASSHDKEMKNLMASKLCRKVVENLEFQPIDEAAYGVDDPSCQKPHESSFGQGIDQGPEDKNAGPSHGYVYE